MTELSDEELERQMRRKLFLNGPSSRSDAGFTDEEKRIAEKLLGRDNAARLQRRPVSAGARFRPAPVSVHYEYWWVESSVTAVGWWRIDRIENGRAIEHEWHGDFDTEVARLRKAGFTVREFRRGPVGAAGTPTGHKQASRKTFTERYGSLLAGGSRR